ncbi:MAG: hypothetical protein AABO58_07625 [Acidobacteriota bacterium]
MVTHTRTTVTSTKTNPTSPTELAESFQRLAESAVRLNKASDHLSKAIAPIETVLKKLNLGISKWYEFAKSADREGAYETKEIGYAKIGGRWCIALAERSGHSSAPDSEEYAAWAFSDAPRQLRIRAVKEIPKLIDALVAETDKVTTALTAETERALTVLETLLAVAAEADRGER